jgi:hypothetical protein
VNSPAFGQVWKVVDHIPYNSPGTTNVSDNWGNYVLTRLSTGQFVLLANCNLEALQCNPVSGYSPEPCWRSAEIPDDRPSRIHTCMCRRDPRSAVKPRYSSVQCNNRACAGPRIFTGHCSSIGDISVASATRRGSPALPACRARLTLPVHQRWSADPDLVGALRR